MKQPENDLTGKEQTLLSMNSQEILEWKTVHRMQEVLEDPSQEGLYEAFYYLKSLCEKASNPFDIIQNLNDKQLQQLRLFELFFNVSHARNCLAKYEAQFAKGLYDELKPMEDILMKGYCALSVKEDLDGSSHQWTALEVEQFYQKQTQSVLDIYNHHLEAPEEELFQILQANCPETFFDWLLAKIQEITESIFGKSKAQTEIDEKNQKLFSSIRGITDLRYQFQQVFFKPAPQTEINENLPLENQNGKEITSISGFQN